MIYLVFRRFSVHCSGARSSVQSDPNRGSSVKSALLDPCDIPLLFGVRGIAAVGKVAIRRSRLPAFQSESGHRTSIRILSTTGLNPQDPSASSHATARLGNVRLFHRQNVHPMRHPLSSRASLHRVLPSVCHRDRHQRSHPYPWTASRSVQSL